MELLVLPATYWAKVDKAGPLWQGTPCWVWRGHLTARGWAYFHWRKRHYRVHRLAYEALVGPIPPGHDVDHKCRNRACVNPAHLQVINHKAHGRLAPRVPRTPRAPCSLCGRDDGYVRKGRVRPVRISGARFSIDGTLCGACYDRLRWHERH